MIRFLFFIPLFFISNLYSLELKCNFEEVYVDESAENFNEMKNVAPNMKTVPVITLNGLLVGGFYELKEKVDA